LITIFLVGHKKFGHNANQKNPDYEENRPETGRSSPWEQHAERKANCAVSSAQKAIKLRHAIQITAR
jgi:hypothetical protein